MFLDGRIKMEGEERKELGGIRGASIIVVL